MNRLIFHVDVNSAFLSWESVRRVGQGMDDLRLIPACIGGDPKNRTSVVLAKSIPAKKYGVSTGESMQSAVRKCPNLIVAPPDFALYQRNSKAFLSICKEYAPVVQQFSIDECFLDFTGTSYLYEDPIKLAHNIKDDIRERLGFTVNIGIAENRLLAKMASDFEKPDKVHTLFSDEIKTKFWPLPVGDLLGVGRRVKEKLTRFGIFTIGDLAHADQSFLMSQFGKKSGEQLKQYAWGVDHSAVEEERQDSKSISAMSTFEEDIRREEDAMHILSTLSDTVCYRLRREKKKAYCVQVTLRGSDFHSRSHQRKRAAATDITADVIEDAFTLLHEMWRADDSLRLIGLALTDLTGEDEEQMSLFDTEKREKERNLDQALDEIRQKFGAGSIHRGMGDSRYRLDKIEGK